MRKLYFFILYLYITAFDIIIKIQPLIKMIIASITLMSPKSAQKIQQQSPDKISCVSTENGQ